MWPVSNPLIFRFKDVRLLSSYVVTTIISVSLNFSRRLLKTRRSCPRSAVIALSTPSSRCLCFQQTNSLSSTPSAANSPPRIGYTVRAPNAPSSWAPPLKRRARSYAKDAAVWFAGRAKISPTLTGSATLTLPTTVSLPRRQPKSGCDAPNVNDTLSALVAALT